jgi:Carboxypeptidase regulatory-like domain/TonB-dependent Receptor Plug Domain
MIHACWPKLVRSFLLACLILSFGRTASSQTAGSVVGQVVEKESGRPLGGVTVVIQGPQGDQGTITGDDGSYELHALPVGTYVVRFYFGNATVERPNVVVSVDKTVRVNGRVPLQASEVIELEQKAPAIDVGSSRVGVTLNQDFLRNVPTPLTLGGVLEKAPGSFTDAVAFYNPASAGLSFNGTTGAENAYILDGMNMTSVGYGTLGFDIASPFIEEVEVVTGGYGAEYGRAMGGVVNIATKSGTNEFRGSAFSYVSPGFLARPRRVYNWSSSLSGVEERDYQSNLGLEVGGPILKNKLFFWVGYAPEFGKNHTVRYVDRFVDANGDGQPDGVNGQPTLEPLGQGNFGGSITSHQYAAKLTFRPAAEHNLSVGFYGINGANEYMRTPNADPRVSMHVDHVRRQDVSARWVSKLFDRRWQLEAGLGLHSEGTRNDSPYADLLDRNNITWFGGSSLPTFDPTMAGRCPDSPETGFQPCPTSQYQSGGYGIVFDRQALRLAAQLKSTHLFRGGGWHQLKYGADYERNTFDDTRYFSGPVGARGRDYVGDGFAQVVSYYRLQPGDRLFKFFGDDTDPDPGKDGLQKADLLAAPRYQDAIRAQTQTINTSVFIQDSYSPVPSLTLNVGVRWEGQKAEDYLGGSPLSIYDNFAPRVGAVFDPTSDGRAKIFGHYGRYYESIPMDINDRAFGGEGSLISNYDVSTCNSFDKWAGGVPAAGARSCATPSAGNLFNFGGENLFVQRKIKASYTEEVVMGGQYEVAQGLVLGASYIKRWLGRAIEDTAEGLISNPGDIPASVLADYEQKAAAAAARAAAPGASAADQVTATETRFVADAAKIAAAFPKPRRDYDAVQLTAAKRFSNHWLLQASYTYSRTRGNYPGLYAADAGQLDPNVTSLYDLESLLINRDGPLPNDRPHIFRADGYYQQDIGRSTTLVYGLGVLARSGQPVNTLGSHEFYGQSEAFILPRGSAGRTPVVTRFDLHLGYRTKLVKGSSLDVFVDVFNLFNQRMALTQDQDYTLDAVQSIVGGDASDLAHLKAVSGGPPSKNPNYLAAKSYQPPIAGRLGLRLSF